MSGTAPHDSARLRSWACTGMDGDRGMGGPARGRVVRRGGGQGRGRRRRAAAHHKVRPHRRAGNPASWRGYLRPAGGGSVRGRQHRARGSAAAGCAVGPPGLRLQLTRPAAALLLAAARRPAPPSSTWRLDGGSVRPPTGCAPAADGQLDDPTRGGEAASAAARPRRRLTQRPAAVSSCNPGEQIRAADNRAALNCLRGAPRLQHGGAQGGGCRRPGWWRAAGAARPQSYTQNSKVRAEEVIECGVGTGQRQQKGRRAAVQVRRRAKQTGERRAARRGGTRRRESERNNLDAGRGARAPLACEAKGGNLHGARGCAASRIALDLGDAHPLAAEGTVHQPVVQERWGESHCWPSAASIEGPHTTAATRQHRAPCPGLAATRRLAVKHSPTTLGSGRHPAEHQKREALTCKPRGTRGSPGSRSRHR